MIAHQTVDNAYLGIFVYKMKSYLLMTYLVSRQSHVQNKFKINTEFMKRTTKSSSKSKAKQ